ncbi:DUF1934 domain-containing protein [Paenibacillus lutimineralis]|uniref:DUF1934 domain-containing protein n=1 Tax=Paenibacillus lutimineralis TaxID=2707005 RepID=A0A3S9US47_9BACL|nr:DUF1934 domain-containing protein [Paenibacillus lutimineralis]AZS13135.1 DUF1934 domain-containing protein [Paenibacillus lutimineralis]
MTDKNGAKIVITSRQGQEETIQELTGEAMVRGDVIYIRYEEVEKGPTGGVTRALVKISGDEVKIMRHGEVESEQTFRTGHKLPGFYFSPFTKFHLSTVTHRLESKFSGAFGQVTWDYDLYVYDELSGNFNISLLIQEEA